MLHVVCSPFRKLIAHFVFIFGGLLRRWLFGREYYKPTEYWRQLCVTVIFNYFGFWCVPFSRGRGLQRCGAPIAQCRSITQSIANLHVVIYAAGLCTYLYICIVQQFADCSYQHRGAPVIKRRFLVSRTNISKNKKKIHKIKTEKKLYMHKHIHPFYPIIMEEYCWGERHCNCFACVPWTNKLFK